MKQCKQCALEFNITPADSEFYKKMQVPEPTRCPACREMRRTAFRNERTLYLEKCGLCDTQIFSMHSPGHVYPVYCNDCWLSDKWDSSVFAKDYNFSRPFFDQFKELLSAVPRMATSAFINENSSYINCASYDKNCYLIYGANYNEDVYYGNYVNRNKFCADILFTHDSELCYECVDSEKCYNTKYSRMSSGCTDCTFVSDCKNCMNCFGSAGLRTKQYCLFNKQLTKEEYFKEIAKFDLNSRAGVELARKKSKSIWDATPVKYYNGENAQNITGNSVFNAKDCRRCFESTEVENCSYVSWLNKSKDCYDIFSWGFTAESCYECVETGGGNNNLKFCRSCFPACHSLEYSDYCRTSHDLFGCVGLQKKEYCILNKQYSESEYKALRAKIVEQMTVAGEYGEFFPPALSQYGFNETKGIELYPTTKEEAIKRGFNWQDNMPGTRGKETVVPNNVPDALGGVDENITKEILACVDCGINYKIIKQELALYKKIGVPIPMHCPNCRHTKRMNAKGLHQLFERNCMNAGCKNKFETVYSPDRPEKVFCEECYRKTIA